MHDQSREVVQQDSLKGGLGNVAEKDKQKEVLKCLFSDEVGFDSMGEIRQVTWSFFRRSAGNQILDRVFGRED